MAENKDGIRYPSIDQLTVKTKSKYRLVVGAAKRARDLESGSEKLVENPRSKKSLGIALEEIIDGKIEIIEPEKEEDEELENEGNS